MKPLRIARFVEATRAEGPGLRSALWLQGCTLRCPGCCNPEMFDPKAGDPVETAEILQWIESAKSIHGVVGLTLLGGEPTEQAPALVSLVQQVRSLGLEILLFTGNTLEDLRVSPDLAVRELLLHIDTLVDGPYLKEKNGSSRRWIGSSNQRVHSLTSRSMASDPGWSLPNTLELRLEPTPGGTRLSVNGFPDPSLQTLWRRLSPGNKESG